VKKFPKIYKLREKIKKTKGKKKPLWVGGDLNTNREPPHTHT
jgi:hypothetical protein